MKKHLGLLSLFLLLSVLFTGCSASSGEQPTAGNTDARTDSILLDSLKTLNTAMCGSDVIELLGEEYELLCEGETESVLTYALSDESHLFVVLGDRPNISLSSQTFPHLIPLQEQHLRALYLNGKELQTDEAGNFLLPNE